MAPYRLIVLHTFAIFWPCWYNDLHYEVFKLAAATTNRSYEDLRRASQRSIHNHNAFYRHTQDDRVSATLRLLLPFKRLSISTLVVGVKSNVLRFFEDFVVMEEENGKRSVRWFPQGTFPWKVLCALCCECSFSMILIAIRVIVDCNDTNNDSFIALLAILLGIRCKSRPTRKWCSRNLIKVKTSLPNSIHIIIKTIKKIDPCVLLLWYQDLLLLATQTSFLLTAR